MMNGFNTNIEAEWDEAHLLETDKAWDAIHRCLTDGSLSVVPSSNPLSKLVLGPRQLFSDTQRYIVNFIEHDELSAISTALKTVTEEWGRRDRSSPSVWAGRLSPAVIDCPAIRDQTNAKPATPFGQ